MKTAVQTFSSSLDLYHYAGPFCLVLAFCVSLLKPFPLQSSVHWCALSGWLLCHYLQYRGLGIAIGIVFALFVTHISMSDLYVTAWESGVVVALIAGFVATSLASPTAEVVEKPIVVSEPDPRIKELELELQAVKVDNEEHQKLHTMARNEIILNQQLLEKLRQELVLQRQRMLQEQEHIQSLSQLAEKDVKGLQKALVQEKQEYQLALAELRKKLDEQQKRIAELDNQLSSTPPAVHIDAERAASNDSNYRNEALRLSGLYQQMRDQFKEKSTLLDQTRKELFLTQEKLLHLQREDQEIRTYERTSLERRLEKMLLSMDHHYQREIAQLQSENAQLETLVESLMGA